MDLDAYTAAHRDEWDRLAQLGRKRRFTGQEADELIDSYQSGASQLSAIRSTVGQSLQAERLSLYLARARLRFAGTPANVFSRMPDFFLRQVPAALYRIRWLTVGLVLGSAVLSFLYFQFFSGDPRVLATLGTEAELSQYANEDFFNYYSNHSESSFTALVWTNNAWIAAQCIAYGITGVFVLYMLFTTFSGLGASAAILDHYGRLDDFFFFIAPHGQLELYSIWVAAAAGLAIFWSWIVPGARTRAQALAAEGRALFTVAVGLTMSLFVSGIIEGYVTRQPWHPALKIGIGTVALLAFLAYQWIVGGRAFRRGATGDLDEFEAGATRIYAA
jgi:uncharacterized membrane protein SpoIIM required for sporulation